MPTIYSYYEPLQLHITANKLPGKQMIAEGIKLVNLAYVVDGRVNCISEDMGDVILDVIPC